MTSLLLKAWMDSFRMIAIFGFFNRLPPTPALLYEQPLTESWHNCQTFCCIRRSTLWPVENGTNAQKCLTLSPDKDFSSKDNLKSEQKSVVFFSPQWRRSSVAASIHSTNLSRGVWRTARRSGESGQCGKVRLLLSRCLLVLLMLQLLAIQRFLAESRHS